MTAGLQTWEGEGDFPVVADLVVLSGIYFHHSGTHLETGQSKGGWRARHMIAYTPTHDSEEEFRIQKEALLKILNEENIARSLENMDE